MLEEICCPIDGFTRADGRERVLDHFFDWSVQNPFRLVGLIHQPELGHGTDYLCGREWHLAFGYGDLRDTVLTHD